MRLLAPAKCLTLSPTSCVLAQSTTSYHAGLQMVFGLTNNILDDDGHSIIAGAESNVCRSSAAVAQGEARSTSASLPEPHAVVVVSVLDPRSIAKGTRMQAETVCGTLVLRTTSNLAMCRFGFYTILSQRGFTLRLLSPAMPCYRSLDPTPALLFRDMLGWIGLCP